METSKLPYNLIAVTGPTASGKTSFAAHLADKLDTEIISADSRQVYKKMDLGTGKDYDDYKVNSRTIPYHLIDIAEPGYKYNVYEYQRDFAKVWSSLTDRNITPILCGGTGMYLDAILKGYKLLPVPPDEKLRSELNKKSEKELTEMLKSYKELHNITDIDTKKRMIRALEIEIYYSNHLEDKPSFPKINSVIIGINISREERRRKITKRLKERLNNGMLDEVRKLLDSGISPENLIYYGLEYKYLTLHLIGKLTYGEMSEQLNIAIHQFAKRQMTWFRGMERKGTKINWIDAKLPMPQKIEKALETIISYQ